MNGHVTDRTGQRFGKWTVLRLAPRRNNDTQWFCRCDCGTERSIPAGNLTGGHSTQCSACAYRGMRRWAPGMVVGSRTLVRPVPGNRAVWFAKCNDCGAIAQAAAVQFAKTACHRCGDRFDKSGEKITVNGETHNLAGWARKLGISREAIRIRLKKGMDPVAACTTPRTFRGPAKRAAA